MRTELLEFITDKFTEDSFERMREINEDCPFSTYSKFVKHNKQCLKEASQKELKFLSLLMDMIKEDRICDCDEESFVEFPSEAFYYNGENKIVIMNYQ